MHTSAVRPTGTYQATRALSGGDACSLTRLRRILPFMSDAVARLNAALEGRYAIERERGEGGMATVYLANDKRLAPRQSEDTP